MKSIASVLIERGWCQGDDVTVDGTVCLRGAARIACGGEVLQTTGAVITYITDENVEEFRLALAKLAERIEADRFKTIYVDGASRVTFFNDTHSFDDVLRVAKEVDEDLGL